MKEMRMLGNIVNKLAAEKKCAPTELCNILGCSIEQYHSFLNGRLFLSFEQLESASNFFKTPIDVLLNGDIDYYEKNVVHCMGDFEDTNNREMILDIIDDYLNLKSAVE